MSTADIPPNCWRARFLSFAGRLLLIGSVIHSLTNFWMAAYRLPKECLREIDKLCSAFLWSGPDLNAHKAKIAWSEVCKPKEEGGLGLKPLSEVNDVCCLKLIWRIMSARSSLWVNWVRRHLIRKSSFWSVKETTNLGSWIWRKLLKLRDMATSFLKVDVRNGGSTSFWFDVWTPLGRLIDAVGARGQIDLGIHSSATVRHVFLHHRRRRHRTNILNSIEDMIDTQRYKVQSDEDDVLLWKFSETDFKPRFNSKRTWQLLRTVSVVGDWCRTVWFSYLTPKFAFHTWLSIKNRLSTGDRMLQWNIGATGMCVFCRSTTETRDHLYFACVYTEDIWSKLVHNMLGPNYTSNWDNLLTLLVDKSWDKVTSYLLRYVFQTTLHSIWRERNNIIHGGAPMGPTQIHKQIDKVMRNRLLSLREMGVTKLDDGLQTWFATR